MNTNSFALELKRYFKLIGLSIIGWSLSIFIREAFRRLTTDTNTFIIFIFCVFFIYTTISSEYFSQVDVSPIFFPASVLAGIPFLLDFTITHYLSEYLLALPSTPNLLLAYSFVFLITYFTGIHVIGKSKIKFMGCSFILFFFLLYLMLFRSESTFTKVVSYLVLGLGGYNYYKSFSRLHTYAIFGEITNQQKKAINRVNYLSDSQAAYITDTTLTLGATLTIFSVTNNLAWRLIALAFYITSGWFVGYTRLNQPPLVLLLTTSSEDGYKLAVDVHSATSPSRVASLLSIPSYYGKSLYRFMIRQRSVRTFDDARWKESVFDLFSIAKFVILDARNATVSVMEEAEYCFSSDRSYKVLIVADSIDDAPVINNLDLNNQLKNKLDSKLVNPEQINMLTFFLAHRVDTYPSENYPVEMFLKDIPEKWRYADKITSQKEDGMSIREYFERQIPK